MRLPDASHAVVSREKLVDYLLDMDHPDGGSKARVLATAGFTSRDADELEFALRLLATTGEATIGKPSPYGIKYEIVGDLVGPSGSVRVLTVWMIDTGSTTPRLITVVPEAKL